MLTLLNLVWRVPVILLSNSAPVQGRSPLSPNARHQRRAPRQQSMKATLRRESAAMSCSARLVATCCSIPTLLRHLLHLLGYELRPRAPVHRAPALSTPC